MNMNIPETQQWYQVHIQTTRSYQLILVSWSNLLGRMQQSNRHVNLPTRTPAPLPPYLGIKSRCALTWCTQMVSRHMHTHHSILYTVRWGNSLGGTYDNLIYGSFKLIELLVMLNHGVLIPGEPGQIWPCCSSSTDLYEPLAASVMVSIILHDEGADSAEVLRQRALASLQWSSVLTFW